MCLAIGPNRVRHPLVFELRPSKTFSFGHFDVGCLGEGTQKLTFCVRGPSFLLAAPRHAAAVYARGLSSYGFYNAK